MEIWVKRLALAVALMLALGTVAFGNVELQITEQGTPYTTGLIFGSPCGGVPNPETCVMFYGTVGDWTINLTTGDSTQPSGGAIMDLSSINATAAAGAAPLVIQLSDNGFSMASTSWTLATYGNLVSGSGTVNYSAYLDTGNTLFATTPADLIGTFGPFSAGYGASGTFSMSSGTNYALTEQLTITSGSGGVKWSTDSSVAGTAAAEPGTTLLLSVTTLAGILFRRKLLS